MRVSFCPLFRPRRQSYSPSPTNHSNFENKQNDYGRQRGPDGQRVASEEVQSHACPAKACSDQGATNMRRSDCGREVRALDVPQPEELTECPCHDEELGRDSYLSPSFSSHGNILAGRATLSPD